MPESWRLELDYRELPGPASPGDASESVLILEALRSWARVGASELRVEIADDRLRMLRDGEVTLDLDGAQPREALTPRMLLGRPFAGIRYDGRGDPLAIVVAGPAPARDLLRGLPLRASLAWTRLAFPEPRTSPSSWHARRSPVGPGERLGVTLELHHALVHEGSTARVLLEGDLEASDVRSARGILLDRIRAAARGEARIERSTSRLRCLSLDSEVRLSYVTHDEGEAREHRLHHRSRASLNRRSAEPVVGEDCRASPLPLRQEG